MRPLASDFAALGRTLMPGVIARDVASDFKAWKGTTEPDFVPRDAASDFAAQGDRTTAGLEELETARHGPQMTNVDNERFEEASCSEDDDCSVTSALADNEVAHVLIGQMRCARGWGD